MAKLSPDLYAKYFQGYVKHIKLIAPNLFDYLELVKIIESKHTLFYDRSFDKQNLTIFIHLFEHSVSQFRVILPDNIVVEED